MPLKFLYTKQLFIFIFVLGVGFFFRLHHLSEVYRVDFGDVSRDYLIAHHIVAYHEYPLVGPRNSVYDHLKNSPLYYYVLAFPLMVHDSIYTLAALNILLQLVTILSYYGLAHLLFGRKVALLAGVLFSVSYNYFSRIDFIWQPFVVEAFVSVSYLLLALGYKRQKVFFVYFSAFLYALSFGLGLYAIPLIPIYLLAIYFVRKCVQFRLWILFVIFFLTTIVVFLPVGIYLYASHQPFFLTQDQVYIHSIKEFAANLIRNSSIYWKNIVDPYWLPPIAYSVLNSILGVTMLFYLMRNAQERKYTFLFIGSIVWLLVISSILRTEANYYYYTPIKGISLLILSEIITALLSIAKVGKFIFFLGASAVMLLVAVDPRFLVRRIRGELPDRTLVGVLDPLILNINSYKATDPYYLENFTFKSYHSVWGKIDAESVFWVALESRFKKRFVKVINDDPNTYVALNRIEDRIYVLCEEFGIEEVDHSRCIKMFFEQHGQFRVVNKISTGQRWQVFLATHR